MAKFLNVLVILAALLSCGCSKREPQNIGDEEFLRRYGNVPATPEGFMHIIDDRNKRAGTKPTDYAQAYESSLSAGHVELIVLQALEWGDTEQAKRLLVTTMNINVGFLPVLGSRTKISKKQREEAVQLAKGYLDYLIAHTNEIRVGRVDFSGCFIGLDQLLKDSPEDSIRLSNLVESVVGWQKKQKRSAEQNSAANGSQPDRSDTSRTSSAAGSRR